MLAADTNVWARAYLNDDAAQAQKARSALAEARTAGGGSFHLTFWLSCFAVFGDNCGISFFFKKKTRRAV